MQIFAFFFAHKHGMSQLFRDFFLSSFFEIISLMNVVRTIYAMIIEPRRERGKLLQTSTQMFFFMVLLSPKIIWTL